MTAKVKDKYERWRSKTVAFRMSEAECDELDTMVAISGLSKQDYIISKLLNKDVVIRGNPRVFKALKDHMEQIHFELTRIASGREPSIELMSTIQIVADVLKGLVKEDQNV